MSYCSFPVRTDLNLETNKYFNFNCGAIAGEEYETY
jgi:hypothetical protein